MAEPYVAEDADIEVPADERLAQRDRLVLWLGSERDRLIIELRRAEAEIVDLRAQRDEALALANRAVGGSVDV